MNLQNLKYTYEILDNVFEKNIAFSLGGYYSLVKQNILEEFRPINDIDVNIIIDKGASMELIQDRIVNFFHDFTAFQRNSNNDYILRLNTEPERNYYKKRSKQIQQDPEIESDVCFSISLTAKSIKDYLDEQKKVKVVSWDTPYYLSSSATYYPSAEWTESPQSAVSSSRLSSPSFYWSGTNNPYEFPIGTTKKIKEKEDPRVFVSHHAFNDFIKKQMFDKLIDLVLSSNNELTIDFFLMEHDPKHNQVFVIEKENYTAYYPILKAKYKYCTEKFTPEKSFKKHILDLSLSFNAKRIRGLNYPEDIELLIKNWEEMHEKDK